MTVRAICDQARTPEVVCVPADFFEPGSAPFASWPATAHDEQMGDWCARCGRPAKPCSIHDPTISGKWKTLTLCDQCYGAIRQMDVRACKWFRRYCARRNPLTPISRPNH